MVAEIPPIENRTSWNSGRDEYNLLPINVPIIWGV